MARSYKDLLDLFKTFLCEEAQANGKTVVLVIDGAQTLRLPLIELLRQLIHYETNQQKLCNSCSSPRRSCVRGSPTPVPAASAAAS